MRIWLGQYTQHYTHDKEVKIMGRQPFRQMKSDGTMQDAGASSGGITDWWELDSTDGFLLIGDGMYNLALGAPFQARGSSSTSQSYNSINTIMLHPFLGPKTGNLAKITVYVHSTTSDGTCDLHVGIYESDGDGYLGDLVGIATFANSIRSTTGAHSQTSFVDTSGSSTTISLTKGKLYYFGVIPKSSTNTASDVGSGFNLKAANFREALNQSGKVSNYANQSSPAYMAFTFTGLADAESDWVWVQLSGQNKPFVIIEY